jgi:antitoxin component of MazEF toxin-antitoxin module
MTLMNSPKEKLTQSENELLLQDMQKPSARMQTKLKLRRDLLSAVTTENIHHETDWGRPVGKECL